MFRLRFIFIVVILNLFVFGLQAQIGNIFWFAAPNISYYHGATTYADGRPIRLHITAAFATQVTISRPADASFTPIVRNLAAHQSDVINLLDFLNIQEIEVYERDVTDASFIQNNGFLIEAYPGEITSYYELDSRWNRDIFPLKSNNGLGSDFWVSLQSEWPNDNPDHPWSYGDAYNGFVIVATEDNTTIDIFPNGNNLEYFGSPPVIPPITLNAGETFAIRAAGRAAGTHLQGVKVHVRDDKKIAISIYDDSIRKKNNDTPCGGDIWSCRLSYDVCGDQIVPTELLGHDYIVMKGDILNSAYDGDEMIFITATEPNTNVYIDGNPVPIATIGAAGEGYPYEIINTSTFVHCDKPVYIFHVTGSGGGGELGGALLPTIDGCTGSNSVTVKRNSNGGDAFILNLMVRNDPSNNDAINNFVVTVTLSNGTVNAYPLTPAHFTLIMGGDFAVLNAVGQTFLRTRIPTNSTVHIENTNARFHLGVLNGGVSNGNKYGYFSDYADNPAMAGVGGSTQGDFGAFCSLDPIHLVAQGGRTYEWRALTLGVFDPVITAQLSATDIADPYFYPDSSKQYNFEVIITGECFAVDTLPITIIVTTSTPAMFELDNDVGCSPFTAHVTSLADNSIGIFQTWIFETAAGDSMVEYNENYPVEFDYLLPENNTDTIQTYLLRFLVQAEGHSCPTEKSRQIQVKPMIASGFSVDTTHGCPPLDIQFTNSSIGNTDSSGYYWDFGDGSQSIDIDPTHRFYNFEAVDSVYTVTLIAESPFACKDTSSLDITVHPRVRTVMAIETSAACSPLDIEMNPGNSIGVDSFFWHIDYWYGDSNYIALNKDPIHLYHRDTSIIGGPDTLHINLWGKNVFGCIDSFLQRDIVVFPEMDASFGVDKIEICDADSILFTNTSIGYNLLFAWAIDSTGPTFQDTTGAPFWRDFYNRSFVDSSITITLKASSDYHCFDECDTVITVHPFIRANFGIDYNNNCAPLLATFSNLSVRADFYEWTFGDDSTSTTSDASFTHPYWNFNEDSDTTYNIQLVTKNNEGCSDTLKRSIFVFPQVVADFDLIETIGCSPLSVTFQNNSTGGALSYLWNFGDNTTHTNPAPSFINEFINPAQNDTTYIITLTANNSFGCDSALKDSVVVFAAIDALFNIPVADSCPPFTIRPENLSSVGAKIFDWDFGSGYSYPDEYEPVVPAFDNFTADVDTITGRLIAYSSIDAPHMVCADTHNVEIHVYPLVTANFTTPDPIAFCSPYTLSLNNTSTNADSYIWDFGDVGGGSSDQHPDHFYENFDNTNDDNHTIELVANSDFNCTDTITIDITVYAKPYADFGFPTASDCPPFIAQMTNISVGSVITYDWDFAGENSSTERNPSNEFGNETSAVVSKPITLTVTSDKSCADNITKFINIYPNVVVAFTSDLVEGCSPLIVQFTGDTANISSMQWHINGQIFSALKDPEHRFVNDTPGEEVFDITFSAISAYNCSDDTTATITVFSNPTAEFFPEPTIQSYDTDEDQTIVTFENETFFQNSWRYEWNYGNGVIDNQASETFNYTYGNMYWGTPENNYYFPVQMIAWNEDNPECRDTIIREIQIRPPVPLVALEEDIEACVPFTIDFSAVTKYANSDQYEWDFGDGDASSTDTLPTYTYTEPGIYTVRLVVKGDGGPNSDIRIVTIDPRPTAAFSFNDSAVFRASQNQEPDIISFYNQTRDGDNYWWFFNNQEQEDAWPIFNIANAESTEKHPTWFYEAEGFYYVALIAESNLGCYDTVVHSIPIHVLGEGSIQFPTAFTVDPSGARDEWVSDPADMDTRIFRPYAKGVENYKLEVYNRWGVIVFESIDVNHGWNGYLQGQPAKQDVYIWRAKGRYTNGQPYEESGDVTLIIMPHDQY